MRAELDHLVVTAPTLAEGAEFVARAVGVRMQAGGEHPLMGTHNLVLRLGNTTYLEVIAINPAAPAPTRPRWFALDQSWCHSGPRLATWVARTSNLGQGRNRVAATLGEVATMTRGAMRWRMTIPGDGALVHGGLLPSLIEWQTEPHPASNMRESGCSLTRLAAFHPEPEFLREQLEELGLSDALTVAALQPVTPPRLIAYIDTPTGMRTLGRGLDVNPPASEGAH